MSTTTLAIMFSMSRAVMEVVGGPAAAQATATKLTNALSRVTKSVATGSFILPSILSGEASEPMLLINDTGGTVNVYPATGEKINGAAANSPITFGGGTGYIFFPVLASPGVYPSTLDWRGANIS
jgi:hypothetical protein